MSLRTQQIEELFCLKPSNTSSLKTKGTSSKEISPSLLDSKRSPAVNIFLKQFKCPSHEIVDRIHRCDSSFLTIEHLICLQKILPEADEVFIFKYLKY